MKQLLLGILIIFFAACSPKVSTQLSKTFPALDKNQEVFVVDLSEDTPRDATEIGTLTIGDSGFSTDCGWNVVIEKAKSMARNSGGNVVKITKHIPPSLMGSSCDRISAKILRIDNEQVLADLRQKRKKDIDSTWDYAKLYVYRPSGAGVLVGYDLYFGDSIICRMKNNSKHEIKLKKQGRNTIWAKTESKVSVPVDIEFGREYYLRCTLGIGIMVGRPQLELVEKARGKREYNAVKGK